MFRTKDMHQDCRRGPLWKCRPERTPKGYILWPCRDFRNPYSRYCAHNVRSTSFWLKRLLKTHTQNFSKRCCLIRQRTPIGAPPALSPKCFACNRKCSRIFHRLRPIHIVFKCRGGAILTIPIWQGKLGTHTHVCACRFVNFCYITSLCRAS